MKKRVITSILCLAMLASMSSLTGCDNTSENGESIKVGSIWELSGLGEGAGKICSEAVEYAVKYVNENGGINGVDLEVITEDYQTDTAVAVEKTQKLLLEDEVDIIIGPAMGSGIQAIESTVEQNDSMLIVPILSNGESDSEHILYTGGTIYTSLDGLVNMLDEEYGPKVFIVGSDYSYPVRVSAMTQAIVESIGGEVVGDEYLTVGETDLSTVINKIKESEADYVIHSCVSDSIYAFYQQIIDYGLDDVGIGTLITTEAEAATMGSLLDGTYSGYNWFQCIENEETKSFIDGFTEMYGEEEAAKLNGNAETCYSSILLLAEALKSTDDYSTEGIKAAMLSASVESPQGTFEINEDEYNYVNTYSYIVEWDEFGKATIVSQSDGPVDAQPYPVLLYGEDY